MPEKIELTMTKKKDCKHSVTFEAPGNEPAISTVYVNRTVAGIDKAQRVKVTLELLPD